MSVVSKSVASMTPGEISALTLSEVASLTTSQIQSLSLAQMRAFTEQQKMGLTPAQINAFTPQQIALIDNFGSDHFFLPSTGQWYDGAGNVSTKALNTINGYAVWQWNGTGWGTAPVEDHCSGGCTPAMPGLGSGPMSAGFMVSKECEGDE